MIKHYLSCLLFSLGLFTIPVFANGTYTNTTLTSGLEKINCHILGIQAQANIKMSLEMPATRDGNEVPIVIKTEGFNFSAPSIFQKNGLSNECAYHSENTNSFSINGRTYPMILFAIHSHYNALTKRCDNLVRGSISINSPDYTELGTCEILFNNESA